MSTNTHRGNAEQLGQWLGGVWRGYMRRERQAKVWLVSQGVPASSAVTLLWIVKLGVLAILFYAAFWLALLFLLVVVAAWTVLHANVEQEEPKPEWREGHSGFGLYDKSEWRHDPGDPDDP